MRNLVARFIDQDRAHGVLAIIRSAAATQPEYRLTFAARAAGFDAAAETFVTRETATRRFTYVLGPGETRRTAGDRLAVLAAKAGTATLEDVIAAFDVEPVRKEFFARYKEHYAAFCRHLLESDAPARVFGLALDGLEGKALDRALKPVRDFVKKLLGRLVFLHFLQKKGWLGVKDEGGRMKDEKTRGTGRGLSPNAAAGPSSSSLILHPFPPGPAARRISSASSSTPRLRRRRTASTPHASSRSSSTP